MKSAYKIGPKSNERWRHTMMTWKRARSEDQIESRIREITDATARLYEKVPFDEITFAMIARESGFTRSNLYKYFKTVEEILLEILKNDLTDWRIEVERRIKDQSWNVDQFSRRWMTILLDRGRMVGLLTILHTNLEKNASLEKLTDFKAHTIKQWKAMSKNLADALAFEDEQAAFRFLFAQMAVIIGVFPMWNLSPKQIEAMNIAGMDPAPKFYQDICLEAIRSILSDYLSGRQKEPNLT